MESNEETDVASHPILCKNGCGFYGSTSNGGYCSKCYKQFEFDSYDKSVTLTEEVPQPPQSPPRVVVPETDRTRRRRCGQCNVKVGLTGFGCRCGGVFCSHCRYSDRHGCTFDYKSLGQDQVRKNNPMVKGEKLRRI